MVSRSELEVRVRGRDELSPDLSRIESRLIRFVGAVSSALTAVRVASFPVNQVREFEKEMANVQKTTNFTDGEIKRLGDSLVDLSRRINITAPELAKISAAAGQQGLGREGVEGVEAFTESVARMAAVLDITVEDAGTNVGKIASIFNLSLRDIERAVSAFNEVSNNSTASGEQLLDVVKRIGNAAGSLTLDQAIGVAATGLDLGQSPEVVGTSFAKVFAEMFARADEFSKLLGISVADWMNTLQNDGVQALQMYLQGLRTLTQSEQQKWIKQLSGGGRIGVLVTKLVQDVEDAILRRNVAFGEQGFVSATSALKEQQTVLATLDAEITKAGNSFQALGIKAGEVFAGQLAASFAQLNAALSDDDVIAFAQQIGETFLDVFQTIADGIKFVASLNVNWENFIVLAKGLLGLKVASFFANKIAAVGDLSLAYRTAATAATEGARAEQAAAAVGQNTIRGQIAQIRELIAARAQYQTALQKQAALEAAAAQQAKDLTLARIEERAAQNALAQATTTISAQNPQVAAAQTAVITAERNLATQVAALRQQHQARLQSGEQEHQNRLRLIEAEFQAKKQAAQATGNKALLAAAKETQVQQIAAEEAFFARSIRGVEQYYARRILAAQQAGTQEVAAARLAFAQSLSAFDGTVASQGFSKLQTEVAAAGTKVQELSGRLDQTRSSLTAARSATLLTATAMQRLQVVTAFVGRAFNVLIGVLSKAFFWFTIIYTVLDITGLLDSVQGGLKFLTDALGLSSEAARRKAREMENLNEKLRENAELAREAGEELEKLFDKTTRQLDQGFVSKLTLNFQDPDPEVARKAFEEYANTLEQIDRRTAQLMTDRAAIPERTANVSAQITAAREKLAEFEQELASLEERAARPDPRGEAVRFADQSGINRIKEQIDAQKDLISDLEQQYSALGDTGEKALGKFVDELGSARNQLDELTRTSNSALSADAFLKFGPQVIEQLQRRNEAQEEYQRLVEESSTAEGEAAKTAAQEAADLARQQVEVANRALFDIQQEMLKFINDLKANGSLSDAIVGSLDAVPIFLARSESQINLILGSINRIKQAGLDFTATTAPAPVRPSSGDRDLPSKAEESEERKRSRARIDLAKAELQAIANLEKQANKEQQDELEFAFDRSLISIRGYYAERKRLQQEAIDVELKEKRLELDALNEELGKVTVESARIRAQADVVRAQGAIDLLLRQREALTRETEREEENALIKFVDEATAQKKAILDFFGTTDSATLFEIALNDAANRHREILQRMERQAEEHPDLLPFIDALKLQNQLMAVQAVFENFERQSEISNAQVSNVETRLNLLRNNGLITFSEFAATLEEVRSQQASDLEKLIKQEEEYLSLIYDQTKAFRDQSPVVQQLAIDIEARRNELEQLRIEGNEVAKQLNDDLRGALKGFIKELATGTDIGEALNSFGLRLLESLVDVAAEDLSTKLLTAIGSTGSEGFGGFFASLFGATAEKGTDLNPMVVREQLGQNVPDLFGDAAKEGLGSLGDGATLSDVADTVEDGDKGLLSGFFDVGENLVNSIGSGLSSLGGLLTSLFTSLIGVITASAASNSASGIASAAGSIAAAHTGGVVGRLTMSRTGISPAVFANAMRYHGGGLPGMTKDEVAAILLKGEEVLSKDDPRNVLNGGKRARGEDNRPILRQRLLPILDPDLISEALRGPAGEELIELVISRNPAKFNSLLKG